MTKSKKDVKAVRLGTKKKAQRCEETLLEIEMKNYKELCHYELYNLD